MEAARSGALPRPLTALFASTGFQLEDASHWTPAQAGCFSLAVMGALGFLNTVVPRLFAGRVASVPAQGSHHDRLDVKDHLFLAFNKLASVPFSYHFLRACWRHPAVHWCAAGWLAGWWASHHRLANRSRSAGRRAS